MRLKVGQKLLEIREEKKLSQNEFADLLSISPSAYSRLERNETQADMEMLNRFSTKLNVPLQEFLPDTISFTVKNDNTKAPSIIW